MGTTQLVLDSTDQDHSSKQLWKRLGLARMTLSNAPGSGSIVGWELGDERFRNLSNDLFTKPAWICRNQTFLRAIEDLANNITISMLSSASLV